MAQTRTSSYEGMFLVSQSVATDLNAVTTFIRQSIEKNGGKVIAMRKWDERRLSFEIQKQKRGYYLLAYFSMPTINLSALERSFNLSELIMRQLITKVEHLTLEQMQAADATADLATEAKLRASQPIPVAVTPVPEVPVDDQDDE